MKKQRTISSLYVLGLLILALFLVSCSDDSNDNVAKNAEKSGKAGQKTFTNSIGMEFVLVPAGSFMMGADKNFEDASDNEGPVHTVKISKPFYLGKYEVTQEQWVAVMGSNPSKFKGRPFPVEQVSWNDSKRFIQKLNTMEGGNKYRLPTEAEWEYACRAGTITKFSFGDDEGQLESYAWFRGNSGERTHPVGQLQPNPWGLYDMYGNVSEWVEDQYHRTYYGAPNDGSAWLKDGEDDNIVRGCSWLSEYRSICRSANRSLVVPNNPQEIFGFRLVRIP